MKIDRTVVFSSLISTLQEFIYFPAFCSETKIKSTRAHVFFFFLSKTHYAQLLFYLYVKHICDQNIFLYCFYCKLVRKQFVGRRTTFTVPPGHVCNYNLFIKS